MGRISVHRAPDGSRWRTQKLLSMTAWGKLNGGGKVCAFSGPSAIGIDLITLFVANNCMGRKQLR